MGVNSWKTYNTKLLIWNNTHSGQGNPHRFTVTAAGFRAISTALLIGIG